MKVTHLGNIDFNELIDCFLEAFENYFVKMPTEKNYYKERWLAANVDYSLSYGMFDQGKLVGFIIHAVGTNEGRLTAYNTGTGVIPAYRGQRIIKSIYNYAIDDLKQNGIQCCTLEVITENERALKAYLGIGFEICKTYKIFGGKLNIAPSEIVDLIKRPIEDIEWSKLPNQSYYSWDNRKESVQRANYDYYEVSFEGRVESFFIMNVEKQYIAQFDLLTDNQNAWDRLFAGISQLSKSVRTNNVDDRLKAKVEILTRVGLDNPADQYEMKMEL